VAIAKTVNPETNLRAAFSAGGSFTRSRTKPLQSPWICCQADIDAEWGRAKVLARPPFGGRAILNRTSALRRSEN
jgi:hypothetical protein